jgi:hypothetical protein
MKIPSKAARSGAQMLCEQRRCLSPAGRGEAVTAVAGFSLGNCRSAILVALIEASGEALAAFRQAAVEAVRQVTK